MASPPTAGVVGEQAAPDAATIQDPSPQAGGGDGADQAGEKAAEAADQAREKAGEVADQAREKAGEAADQARGKLREQVDERSTKLGEEVGSTASDLRTVGDELRKQGKDTPARLADQ